MAKYFVKGIGAGAAALMISAGMAYAGAGGDECCARAEELERENNLLKAQLENMEEKSVPLIDIPGDLSANAAFSTDYSFRGISQTGNDPALSGGIDWSHDSGFYIGTWVSNVDFTDSSPELEVDIYGGYGWDWSDVAFDLGVLYYHYANINEGPAPALTAESDYVEFYGSVGTDFGPVSTSLGVAISPDYFAESGFFAYPNLSVGVAMPGAEWLTFDGTVGYSFIDDNAAFGTDDYVDYGVSVSALVEDLVTLSVGYYGTDLDTADCFGGDDRACDGRVIGTVAVAY